MPQFRPSILVSDAYGSAGNTTWYHRDGKCYTRKRSHPVYEYCGPVGASGRASQGIGRLEDCSPLYTTRLESSRGGGGTASASFRSPGTYLRPESVRVGLPRILHAGRRASSRTTAFRLLPPFAIRLSDAIVGDTGAGALSFACEDSTDGAWAWMSSGYASELSR